MPITTRTAGRADSTPCCEYCTKEIEDWQSGRYAPYCSATCQRRAERPVRNITAQKGK